MAGRHCLPEPSWAVNTSVTLGRAAGGSSVSYSWSLEEGLRWETQEPFTTLSFPSPGLCLVTVVAENQLGSANASVEVVGRCPSVASVSTPGNWMAALWWSVPRCPWGSWPQAPT